MLAKRLSLGRTHSARSILWNRSIFPIVVGEYGAVSRCRTPFLHADPVEDHRPRDLARTAR